MFGMGVPELIIILVVVLIIFGPKNLPKLGASIGKTVKNFRNETEGTAEKPSENKVETAASSTSDAAASTHGAPEDTTGKKPTD